MGNRNVIDVEIAFGLDDEENKRKSTNRIDFAAIQTGVNGPEIVFFEAKCFVNPEIRTSGDAKPPVVTQIQGYKNLLQLGRASCRERVCQYVSISVVAVSLKKKKNDILFRQHTHNTRNK